MPHNFEGGDFHITGMGLIFVRFQTGRHPANWPAIVMSLRGFARRSCGDPGSLSQVMGDSHQPGDPRELFM